MAHQHSPRFMHLCEEARKRITEVNVDQVKDMLQRRDHFVLVDVREESEWARDHLPGAMHLCKGIIERDIEQRVPDMATKLVLYCGGGYRSALAADNLRLMGYAGVQSMAGGIRLWRERGYPLTVPAARADDK